MTTLKVKICRRSLESIILFDLFFIIKVLIISADMAILFEIIFIHIFCIYHCVSSSLVDSNSNELRQLFIAVCESRIEKNGPLRHITSSQQLIREGAIFNNTFDTKTKFIQYIY